MISHKTFQKFVLGIVGLTATGFSAYFVYRGYNTLTTETPQRVVRHQELDKKYSGSKALEFIASNPPREQYETASKEAQEFLEMRKDNNLISQLEARKNPSGDIVIGSIIGPLSLLVTGIGLTRKNKTRNL